MTHLLMPLAHIMPVMICGQNYASHSTDMSSRRSSAAAAAAAAAAMSPPASAPRSRSDGQSISTRKRKFTGPAAGNAATQTPIKPTSRTRQSSASSTGSTSRARRQQQPQARASGSFEPSPTIDSSDSDSNDVEMTDASPDLAGESEPAEPTAAAARTEGADSQAEPQRDGEADGGEAGENDEERKSAAADEADGSADPHYDSGTDDEEEEGGGEYAHDAHENRPSELLTPSVHALEEVDENDAFGSAERRATALVSALSPLTRPASLPGLEAEQALLSELLARTFHASQNNAALLLGPRGCGKSALLDVCLARLRAELQAEGKSFVVVRLSGLVQSDDTLAMRAIVAQLAADHEIEPLRPGADFHALLAFLHEILAQGSFDSLPIFFVLDDFHAFVARAKQTLLYNLCDLLQSSRAQMALIGLTPHLDCYERLEKRIRSRMSHRRILVGAQAREAEREAAAAAAAMDGAGVPAPPAPSPKDLQREAMDNLLRVLRARLELGVTVPADDDVAGVAAASLSPAAAQKSAEEKKQSGSSKRKSSATAAAGASATSAAASAASSFLAPSPSASPAASSHNIAVSALLSSTRSPRLHARLALLLSLGRSTGFFLRCVRLAVCSALGPTHPHLLEEDLLWALDYQDRDWTTAALNNCTELELTLLVSLLQLSRRHIAHRNFALLYASYRSFYARATAGQMSSLPLYAEGVAAKAFEGLLAAGSLLVWADGPPSNPSAGAAHADPLYTGRAVQRRFAPVRMRVTEQELLHALKSRAVAAPTWLVQWATKGMAE